MAVDENAEALGASSLSLPSATWAKYSGSVTIQPISHPHCNGLPSTMSWPVPRLIASTIGWKTASLSSWM